jgi:hypothetical protein
MNYVGSKLAARGVDITVEAESTIVQSIAKKLAITLVTNNDSVSSILSVTEAEKCFSYALQLILRQDSGAKPSFELVPTFLSDITIPLNTEYRGVRIKVSEIEVDERPDSYETFLDVLSSVGIPVGKILKVAPEGTSNVLRLGILNIAGADMLVGLEGEISLEELIVRSMLNVPQQEQDKLDRVLGHMDNMYVSRDELVRQWACALPVGRRSSDT